MKHIVFGGNGFVGTQLVARLIEAGETVISADIALGAATQDGRLTRIPVDLIRRETLDAVPMAEGDMVYNLAAKMLSPLQIRSKRYEFFYPVNLHGVEKHPRPHGEGRRAPPRAVHHGHDLWPHA